MKIRICFTLFGFSQVSALHLQPETHSLAASAGYDSAQLMVTGHGDPQGHSNGGEPHWQRIKAGPKAPPNNQPFTLKNFLRSKEAIRDCWLVKRVKPENMETGMVALPISHTGSDSINDSLHSLALKHGEVTREYHPYDCALHEVQDAGARKVVVALEHPVQRIALGVQDHLNLKTKLRDQSEHARHTFNHNFRNVDQYLNALRDADHQLHKKAMAVTYCHDCNNFMLPVKGFYVRNSDTAELSLQSEAPSKQTVKFLCSCKLAYMTAIASEEWGLGGQVNASNFIQPNRTTLEISGDNRKWVEETYSEDLDFYKERCGATCGDA